MVAVIFVVSRGTAFAVENADDDLARVVGREGPEAADAQRGPLAQPHELRRQQRRVGRDDA